MTVMIGLIGLVLLVGLGVVLWASSQSDDDDDDYPRGG